MNGNASGASAAGRNDPVFAASSARSPGTRKGPTATTVILAAPTGGGA